MKDDHQKIKKESTKLKLQIGNDINGEK